MKTEFLKELGLEQSVIDKIMAENGKDVESHKQRFDVEKARADGLQTQLAEANKQIESFKGMDIDGIKKNADDYKAKYEAAEKKAKEDLDALRFDHALDSALSISRARSASGERRGAKDGEKNRGVRGRGMPSHIGRAFFRKRHQKPRACFGLRVCRIESRRRQPSPCCMALRKGSL